MVGSALALLVAAGAVRAAEGRADSHFHVGNYAMQGISLRTFVDSYMGDRISRAAVFGIPLQQKWDRFEHYEGDRIPPNYYLGPKAGMYYYAFIDAMVALEYLRLPAAARARLDPMIVGFNPMDQYGVDHVKRCLLLFPGVFTGIGEVSVHKELVGDKIGDDLIRASAAALALLPPDATDSGRNSLYNPALRVLLRFAADAGLLVILHNDVYPAHIAPAGMILGLDPDRTHAPGLIRLCKSAPDAAVIWAHTGLGRFVRPSARHLETVSEVFDACPAWNVDLSWDVVQEYLVHPGPAMPSLEAWAAFVTRYQDRILWGSDAVAFTRNRIDAEGRAQLGSVLPVADYRRVVDMLQPLWELVGPEVARKVQGANHARLFDAARGKVRAWESAHANDDPWNLPVP
jgi:hypothetical protein